MVFEEGSVRTKVKAVLLVHFHQQHRVTVALTQGYLMFQHCRTFVQSNLVLIVFLGDIFSQTYPTTFVERMYACVSSIGFPSSPAEERYDGSCGPSAALVEPLGTPAVGLRHAQYGGCRRGHRSVQQRFRG